MTTSDYSAGSQLSLAAPDSSAGYLAFTPGRGGGKVEEDSLYWGVILLPRPVSGCVNKHMSVTSVATEQKPEVF